MRDVLLRVLIFAFEDLARRQRQVFNDVAEGRVGANVGLRGIDCFQNGIADAATEFLLTREAAQLDHARLGVLAILQMRRLIARSAAPAEHGEVRLVQFGFQLLACVVLTLPRPG